MLKIVLYEYSEGRTSPVEWYRNAEHHDVLKWLGRGIQPSRTAWYNFRDRMDKVIHEVNDGLIRQAIGEGLAQPQRAAQDGTTFRSQASRHQTFNQETLSKRQRQLEAVIQADKKSTAVPEPHPKWMPATPAGRLDLYDRMKVAERELHRRLLENREKRADERRLEKNIVVSLTDPEAPFARDKEKTYCFLYTTQFMVDVDSLLVLGYSIAAENTDVGTLAPMIDRVQTLIGGTLEQVSVDAGYTSLLDLMDCRDRNIDLLGPVQSNSFTHTKMTKDSQQIGKEAFQWLAEEQTYQCPQGHLLEHQYQERLKRHGGRSVVCHRYRCPPQFCQTCSLRSRCSKNPATGRTVRRLEGEELIDAQREKMQRPEIKALYRQRGQTIERAFADAKGHRNFRRFHGRGLSRARAEVGLLVLTQNILAVDRLRRNAKNTEKQAA